MDRIAPASWLVLLALGVTVGCECGPSVTVGGAHDGGGQADAGAGTDAGSAAGAGTSDGGPDRCIAPDVLIALDRTLTMHREADGTVPPNTDAGHARSKWSMAIKGIHAFTAPPLDGTIRFGLELWPKVEPGCITLSQKIAGQTATNPYCEGPEVLVETQLDAGTAITGLLDPETTRICGSTPTGTALVGARQYLESHRGPERKQFVVLVTDGVDWAFTCAQPDPLETVDQLADAGIGTIVVGFSAEASLQGGVGAGFLNDMACAGGLAQGFPGTCTFTDAGVWRAKDRDAGLGNTLFLTATDSAGLVSTLNAFAQTVCCDCFR